MSQLKQRHFTLRVLLAIVLLFILSVTSACDYLGSEAEQMGDELIRGLQAQLEAALQQAISSLSASAQEAFSDAVDSVSEWGQSQVASWEMWLGQEAPAEAGCLESSSDTVLPAAAIQTAFQEKFREVGGARVLGWPSGCDARSENGTIVQRFEKGGIIMADEEGAAAHYMLDSFYDIYQSAGGTLYAGIPTSDPHSWNIGGLQFWAQDRRGKRQLMELDGEEYALLRAGGSDEVYLVPPKFWAVYTADETFRELGYPLSSFPLDEEVAIESATGNSELEAMIDVWQERPYRILIFSYGSIWFDNLWDNHEVLQAQSIGRFYDDEPLLLESIGSRFGYRGYAQNDIQDPCLSDTVRSAGSATTSQAKGELIEFHARSLLEGSVTAIPTSSLMAYVGKVAMAAMVDLAGSNDLPETSLWFGVGVLADGFFSKAVGDYLAAPLTQISTTGLKEAIERVDRDRVTTTLKWGPGRDLDGIHDNRTPGEIAAFYDPLTHMVSGVMHIDNCPHYAFQVRVESLAGEPVENAVWLPQDPEYFDLTTRQQIR